MLRERIVTAAALAALLLGSLLSGEQILFSLLLAVFVNLAAWEWAYLAGCRQVKSGILYSILVTLSLPLLYFSIPTPWIIWVILLGAIWWCMAAVMVLCYQAGGQPIPASRRVCYLLGYFVFLPAWIGLVSLYPHRQGPQLLLLFFGMIWLVDSAAFFAGRRWGKRKLASRVSPGKSWEGFIAGMLVSLLPALAFIVYANVSGRAGLGLMVLCIVSSVFSVMGDLFISMFKRHADVKDSSRLLPGHGGVLDRIDSITAAAPVFVSGIWMLEGKLL